MGLSKLCVAVALLMILGACSTLEHKESRRYPSSVMPPRSILVLPPLNESDDVRAPYSYISTISEPLGEIGYYVLPVAVIDAYLKANGLPNPYEMHQVSIEKYKEILGADAVLYIEIDRYGQQFNLISSNTVVKAKAKLVDTQFGERMWNGSVNLSDSSDTSQNLTSAIISAVVTQVIKANRDPAHSLSRDANWKMIHGDGGLPVGPYYKCETEYCSH